MLLLVCWWKHFVIQLFNMNKQFGMCAFWMMEKIAFFSVCVCVCAYMLVLGPILWWHMSCPMLWVLPLSCNNTPQCCLKYSWPGKLIALSQSHGFLIIPPPPLLSPPGHYIPPAFFCISLTSQLLGCILHSHPVLRLELKMPLSCSLLIFLALDFRHGL